MSSEERKEGMYWTNEDGTTGYRPFSDDNFEDCQHCGRPHGDEVEIVQGKDRAIVFLHPECEAPYRQRWGDKVFDEYDRYLSTCVRAFANHWSSDVQMKLRRCDL